ncbi:MAG: Acetyltransferase domain [Solirubrobacteraceae bacterium]|nr:Acetyltransferase domain [Solirubrobacteraceae bacterium]
MGIPARGRWARGPARARLGIVLLPDASAPAPADLLVRPAGPGDRRRIRRLFDENDVRLSTADLRRLTEADQRREIVLAVLAPEGEHLVALARATRLRERAETAEVTVTVAADWRRTGVGSAALTALNRRAAAAGLRTLVATAPARDPGAHRLLHRCGFQAVTRGRYERRLYGRAPIRARRRRPGSR